MDGGQRSGGRQGQPDRGRFGYDNATLAEPRHPTRDELDRISRDVPILLVHQSGHIIAVNSKAIEVAGITADTPDPWDGYFVRDPDGTPTGCLQEGTAYDVLQKVMPRPDTASGSSA